MRINNRLTVAALGGSLLLSMTAAVYAAEGPYGGTPAAIPGTVQAANYDSGGQGVGYSVTSVNGSANSYRSDGVDLEVTSDTGGGYDIGWSSAGQWFRYTVNVATAGTYTVTFRVAAESAVTDAFHLSNSSGTNLSGPVNVPDTGAWQTWTTVTATVSLPAGQQVLTLSQDAAGWNIHNFAFVAQGEAPYGGTPAAIPGTVLGENYDTGGQGVGYDVSSVNGTDNGYRSDGVDLETTSATGGGNDLGWTAAGQWFRYTVNVATAGTYTVAFEVTAPSAVADAFHLSNSSGTNLSGSVNIPDTGGWQTWTTVTANVTLPAGTQTLTLNQDSAGWNIYSLAFAAQTSSCNSAPGVPTGLAASGTSSSGTTLTWTAVTAPVNCSITSYTVLENGNSIGTATGTSFAVTGLSASTAYSFAVEATDSHGTSAASAALSVTTSASGSGSGCAAAWSATTIYTAGMEANVDGINYVANYWTEGNNPTSNNGGTGSGEPWTSLGACSSCTTVPSTPTGLEASGTTFSSTNLAWQASTAASNCSISGYTVYRNGSSVGTTTTTSFTAGALSASTDYSFTVAASDSAGSSSQSSSINVTTPACTTNCTVNGNNTFAPYIDMSITADENIVTIQQQSGIKAFTLAFLDAVGACDIGWGGLGGTLPTDTLADGASILNLTQQLQAAGVTLIYSIGGANGVDPAAYCTSASSLQAVYQSAVSLYGIKYLDFDIEGAATANQAEITLRDQALVGLKAANPNLVISYTIPVLPTGLVAGDGLNLLTSAKSDGVALSVVNIMTMDYAISGEEMGNAATEAAAATEAQIQAAGLSSTLGITPMIGQNDSSGEIFTLADATTLLNFANANSYVTRLAMWSVGRDNGGCAGDTSSSPSCSGVTQSSYEFSSIFNAY